MVRDDRRIQPVPAPRGEGRGADEAERVRPQEVEARVPVEPLDVAGQEQGGDRPAQPAADRQPVDGPVRHALRVALVAGQEELDGMAEPGEMAEHLALVGLAARGGLGIDAAVGGADPHAFPRRPATNSRCGRIPKSR